MGRRGVAVVVAVVAVAIAIWIWQRDDAPSSPAVTKPATAPVGPRVGNPQHFWYEQRGAAQQRIAGVVLDETRPVSGATVRLVSRLVMAGAAVEQRVVTDANGHFDFGPQAALHYIVSAELPQRTMATALVDLRTAAPADDLHLVLQPCEASLSGTIRDLAGGAIAKARVTIGEGDLATSAGTVADEHGTYQLCVPAGNPSVVVTAPGYANVVDHELVTGPVQRDFVLGPEVNIAGRVVHAEDRRPIANALVELQQVGHLLPSRYAVSDDGGAFQFAGATPGSYALLVKGDGVASLHPIRGIAVADEVPQVIVCIVEDTATVSGKIVEEGTETPVANAQLILTPKANDQLTQYATRSQVDGLFSIDHVLPGTYQPVISSGWIADHTKSIVVARNDVSGLVVELDRGGSISGYVTSRGLPMHGAQVTARGPLVTRTVETDHSGAFAIDGLRDGPYEMHAESSRARAFSSKQTITIGEDEHKSGVELDLKLGASIAGVVVDQNDSPVGGVELKFSQLGGATVAVATTAKDGSFKVTSLAGGEYTYDVRVYERLPFASYPPADRKRFTPIAVADDTTQVSGIRIRVLRQNLSIAGRATGPDGEPVANASIALHPTTTRGFTQSDATGAFEIRDLPEGRYQLLARSARGGAYASVEAGQTDVQLRFERNGSLEGTLEGFDEVAEVVVHGVYRVTAERSFRVPNLQRGRAQVVATSKSGTASAMVEIVPGETTKVVLRRAGYGWIKGTLSYQDTKERIAGVGCNCYAAGVETAIQTDASGAFLCQRMPSGRAQVSCAYGASESVEVIENREVRVALLGARPPPPRPRLYAGLGLEVQFGRMRVRAVVKNTSAAKAGIVVGDVIVAVDENAVDQWGLEQVMSFIEERPPGVLKLKIERGDTELIVPMTLEPRR